ncbi:MAG: hypothetical protein SFZ24_08580 [Planctomycetota bacterium]|nr:hypothetical protein [Planctomycetota bacterium]
MSTRGPTTAPSPAGPRRSRVPAAACLAAIALLTLLGGAGLWLASRPPAWWSALPSERPDAPDRAAALENGALTALHTFRAPDETWTVELKQDDANAWIAHRLARWLENRALAGPETRTALSAARLSFESDRVRAALPAAGRVITLSVRLAVSDDGALYARDVRLAVGSLPVPAWALKRLSGLDEARADPALIEILAGRTPLVRPAELVLEDGRTIRLLEIRAHHGTLRLTCATRLPSSTR